MIVLDLGCGQATISMGIAEVVPHGRVLGVDIDRAGPAAARGDAATIDCGNLAFAAADGRRYLSTLGFSTRSYAIPCWKR